MELPRPADKHQSARDVTIRALYADPTARHLIVTTTSGDAFYLPITPGNPSTQSRRPRALRLKQSITAVAWSPVAGSSDDIPTTDVLLGSSTGAVLSLPLPPTDDIFKVNLPMGKQVERDLQTVYTLPDAQPIQGLSFGFWNADQRSERRAWAVVTTKDRIYEIQGPVTATSAGGKGGGWAEELFKTVREGTAKLQELPGDPPTSELRVYSSSRHGNSLPRPSAIAWMTAQGLYHSPLASSLTHDILYSPNLLPYPPAPELKDAPVFSRQAPPPPSAAPFPISMVITQWHWLFLYPERIVAVSRESEKVVWDEELPLVSGRITLR